MTGYLRGGLGNQMFIAATTLAQSARHGVPFELDDSFLARNSAHVGDLGAFDHRARVVRRAPRWVAAEPTSRPARVARPLGILSSVFTERSYAYDPRIERISPGTLLNGYFQSWRYFDSIASEVRTRFWTLLEPSSWFVTTEQELASLGPWVGVHVRQGDYLRPKVARNHGLVAGAYLDRALNLVRQLGHDGRLVLFSDDPARAVALHPELRAAHRVQPPEGSHPAESMLLLAGAPALITANSSFSWWAGYLGDRPGRPVVCPRPWFGALAGDTRDLLLPHWTTVDRRDLGWAAAATGVRAAVGRPD
jgi:hypothetical protein